MRPWLLILASAVGCTGCTTFSLEQHVIAQAASTSELRYREVLDNLAMVANDPYALPVYTSLFAGTAQVTDSAQVGATTQWQHVLRTAAGNQSGFASEAANPQASRMVLENWTLDPVVVPEKLEAMRCACQWVIYGPERACADCPGLLASPDQAPSPGRHFGVADRLARLPPGWLHLGTRKDVPLSAAYKAHAGDTWVWVMPDGLEGLADFTLVFQDIVRINSNSPTLFYPLLLPSPLQFITWPYAAAGGRQYELSALVVVDPDGRLVPDQPYYRWRVDNVGADAHLRSQINAAGLSH
ncbi:MAG TPA: hypothetical protein VKA46_42300 [Gemmataceae bacterium]|nr:hypothetical protein [Gemmataceae bacterium]